MLKFQQILEKKGLKLLYNSKISWWKKCWFWGCKQTTSSFLVMIIQIQNLLNCKTH